MTPVNTEREVDWGVVQRLNNDESTWTSVQELAERPLKPEEWFAGRIKRELAEDYVLYSYLPGGTFLVRESLANTSGNLYALTIKDEDGCSGSKVKHYRIEKDDSDGTFTIVIKPIRIKFNTLTNLIHHFRIPQPSNRAAQSGDRSCSKLTPTPNTNTEMEVKKAVQSAMETVRAPLRETLSCSICRQVSREPTLCISCGQLVGCYVCVLTALHHDERCPLCRATWNKSELTGFIKSRLSFDKALQDRNENPKP